MCAVSVVLDYGRTHPLRDWNQQSFGRFKVLVKEAEKFDADTNQPDCEDPEKAKWMREVEERLARLEG
jgi:hypothetical protein